MTGLLGGYGPHIVRGGFAVLLWWSFFRSPVLSDGQPYPHGIGRFFDLRKLGGTRGALPLRLGAAALLVPYVLGLSLPVVTATLFAVTLVIGSASNSLGKIGHAKQTVAIVLGAQSLACVATALGLPPPPVAHASGAAAGAALEATMLDWSRQVIIAFYLTAGITKLHRSGLAWLRDVALIPVEVVKSVEESVATRGRTRFDDTSLVAADWLAKHPGLTRVFFSGGLFLELAAPLALVNRLTMLAGGMLFLLFHQGIAMLMKMRFVESRALVAIYFLLAEFV